MSFNRLYIPAYCQTDIYHYFQYYLSLQTYNLMFLGPNSHQNNSFEQNPLEDEIKAPKQKPIECLQFPPELKLSQTEITEDYSQKCKMDEIQQSIRQLVIQRKGSADMHYTILGFINRKIHEKNRLRVMSEDNVNLNL